MRSEWCPQHESDTHTQQNAKKRKGEKTRRNTENAQRTEEERSPFLRGNDGGGITPPLLGVFKRRFVVRSPPEAYCHGISPKENHSNKQLCCLNIHGRDFGKSALHSSLGKTRKSLKQAQHALRLESPARRAPPDQ